MPTYTFSNTREWSCISSKSETGALTEYMRQLLPQNRSINPFHSVCIEGPQKDYLLNEFSDSSFGDNGLTGVCIIREDEKNSKNAIIDSLLMSSRIIGRNIEFVYLNYIIKDLTVKGYQILTADYIPTKKNAQVEDFYDKVGFKLMENIDGTKHYTLNVANFESKKVDYIKINSELD